MIAELMILVSVEEDLSDLEELWALIKKIIALVRKGRVKEVDDEHSHSESPQTAEYSEVNVVGGFGGKNTGKPVPWDGIRTRIQKLVRTLDDIHGQHGRQSLAENPRGVAGHWRRL